MEVVSHEIGWGFFVPNSAGTGTKRSPLAIGGRDWEFITVPEIEPGSFVQFCRVRVEASQGVDRLHFFVVSLSAAGAARAPIERAVARLAGVPVFAQESEQGRTAEIVQDHGMLERVAVGVTALAYYNGTLDDIDVFSISGVHAGYEVEVAFDRGCWRARIT
ncbi:MAG: hypothetical protein R3F39_03090 [Myxococcota bacterium]